MAGPRKPEGLRPRKGSSGRGKRKLKVRVKKARGRTTSQVRWLQRQLNDPFVQEAKKRGYRSRAAFKLIGIDDEFDIHSVDPIPGVVVLKKDFYDEDAPEVIMEALGSRRADVVLSDMAAHATGHRQTDHLQIMGLAETAADFARQVLAPGGAFVAKVLRGGTENELLNALKRDFAKVRHFKPEASRPDSAELYVVAIGFRGRDAGREPGAPGAEQKE